MAIANNTEKINQLITLISNLPDKNSSSGDAVLESGRSVAPTETENVFFPDTGYDGFSDFTVQAIPSNYVGSEVPRRLAQTIVPGTSNQNIASGQYLTGTQTILGDVNLIPSNIKKDVVLFDGTGGEIKGTYEGTIVAVEQATPSISVDSYGKVTATATQEAGYVEAGTKTAEKQLNVATYAEYTPTKNDYYIPINNKYVVGNQIIKGDANLIPNNIKKGVSIFNVVGTYEGSSGATTTLKTKEGTFTSGSSNMSIITVDCGFAPAAVTIFVYNASQRRQNNMSFVNHTFGSTTVSMFHNYTDASSCAVYGILEFTETGFTISVDSKNSDGSANSYAFNREFSYYAIG